MFTAKHTFFSDLPDMPRDFVSALIALAHKPQSQTAQHSGTVHLREPVMLPKQVCTADQDWSSRYGGFLFPGALGT